MRYMMLYKAGFESDAGPSQQEIEEMERFISDAAASGVLVATDGLLPSSKGFRVNYDGGKMTVIDGPFTETKELISGYAIVDVKSKDQALELARRFLAVVKSGQSEIRQMYDEAAYA